MDQQDNHDRPVEAKRRKDRAKLIFMGVLAVAVILVYISQQRAPELPDWSGDLPTALAQAEKEDRKLLVFFAGSPPSTNARRMSTTTLRKNSPRIRDRKLITVLIRVKKTDELAKRYDVRELPTFLLLDARGKELNRRVGFVGHMPFVTGFLDCGKVEKAKP
jgi:hypothetical protein